MLFDRARFAWAYRLGRLCLCWSTLSRQKSLTFDMRRAVDLLFKSYDGNAHRFSNAKMRLLCRFSVAGMTREYGRAEAAGDRKAPQHEIARGYAAAVPRAAMGI